MNSNNITLRNKVNVDLLGNITSHTILRYLKEERKGNRKIKVKVKKNNIQLELQSPLIFAQFISLLPMCGISDPDVKKIRFQWKSLRMLYTVVVLALNIILFIIAVNRYVQDREFTYRALGDILFYGSSLLTSIFFLKLVKNWKDLVSQWAVLQSEINNYESLVVKRKISLITICLIFSSIFEHILSNTQFLLTAEKNPDRVKVFLDDGNITKVVGYIPWLSAVVYLLHFLITLIWNYPDIFLTAISLSLANMFEQYNKDLKFTSANISKELSLSYWRKKRELYNGLSLLTKMVEARVSQLVFLCFSVNMYFICIQLLNSIKPLKSLLRVAYFCSSFGHILLRTCSVCFAASSIYENSKESLTTLFSVPSEQYNCEVCNTTNIRNYSTLAIPAQKPSICYIKILQEVQRLITQLSTETLALTGCRFFTVTRTLMLTIAGTIVTYEVVLLQFSVLAVDDNQSSVEHLSQTST